MVKLELPPAGELERDRRSSHVVVYAYVARSRLGKPIIQEDEPQPEFERSKVVQRLTLRPGERRGYWRHYGQKSYQQTIVEANINDHRARVLLDSGAEVSILDSYFARKIGVQVDASEHLECAGVGGAAYLTEGLARVKVTLGGELAYECDVWVGRLQGMHAILGTDFMTPTSVRLDLAEGVARMPDEVRVRFEGRRPLYSDRVEQVRVKSEIMLQPSSSTYLRVRGPDRKRFWVGRSERWVTIAIVNDNGKPTEVKVTNVSDKAAVIPTQTV